MFHAGEIDCLVSRHVIGVHWLGVFSRDELPDLTCEIRPWYRILNTDFNDQPGKHWLALYAFLSKGIKLFDSFGLFSKINSLDSIDPLHLSSVLQSPSFSICGHYCIVYIYCCSRNNSLCDIVYLLSKISSRGLWVKQYIYNLQIRLCILNPGYHAGRRCKLQCQFCYTNLNVNEIK